MKSSPSDLARAGAHDSPDSGPRRSASIAVVTLGCPKNLVDSESMLGQLHRAGYPIASKVEDASMVVVNTCAFLTASQEESIETILEMARLKGEGRLEKLVVAGCLSQRHGVSVLEEIPEVDYLIGPGTLDRIVPVADGLLGGSLAGGAELGGLERSEFEWEPRVLSGLRHSAYLKISEGCNNTCTFCIIPQLRGKHRSRPIEELVAEAERLAGTGVKELVVIAQDTTSYGLDLYGSFSLDRLVRALDQVEGIHWIRLLYTYPRYWTDGLLDAFGSCRRLCPYVDMPVQHASETVLKRMRRGAGWARTRELLGRIRAAAPDMAIRTTVITGFPGETEDEFGELLRAVEEFEFDNLGAFAYSTEEGTPAGAMADQVSQEIRQERRNRVMELQRAVSLRRNRSRLGRTLEVLVDEVDPEEKFALGRWTGQAPEIDGHVRIAMDSHALRAGEVVPVRIEAAGPYDLAGSPSGSKLEDDAMEFSC